MDEQKFFDFYHGMMEIPKGHSINSSHLLFSNANNRMCFIIEDFHNIENPTILRITPFLHDRRIFLDIPREIKDRNFFLTSMEVDKAKIQDFNKKVSLKTTPANDLIAK